MPTCSCRAGTTRCWRARARASLAPNHPRDRHSRRARSRKPEGSVRHREWLSGLIRPLPSARILASVCVQPVKQLTEPVRYTLVHHIVVHGAQLLAEAGLNVAAELAVLGRVVLA